MPEEIEIIGGVVLDSLPVFVITEDDVQEIAREELGVESLTPEQMHRVKVGLSYGLGDWGEIVRIAIEEALKE